MRRLANQSPSLARASDSISRVGAHDCAALRSRSRGRDRPTGVWDAFFPFFLGEKAVKMRKVLYIREVSGELFGSIELWKVR